MRYEIKHIKTGAILFSTEIDETYGWSLNLGLAVKAAIREKADLRGADLSGADLRGSNLRGSNLRGSNLRGSNLSWAYLSGSNLSWADLSWADLRGADLRGADLRGADLIVLQTDIWTVYVQIDHIRIGCHHHSVNDWLAFSDDQISKMSCHALSWCRRWKPFIQSIHATLAGGSHV